MSHNTNEGEGAAGGGADPAAAAAAAAAGGSGEGAAGGAGAAGQGAPAGNAFAAAAASGGDAGAAGEGGAPAAAVVPLPERIPEKYRVLKEDGTLDLEASTAKLLDGHVSLEQRLGTGSAPPKSPDDYAPKPEKFDMEAVKTDPQYKGWLKGAHAKGMTNDQVAYVLDTFADRLEQMGDGGLSTADFEADMKTNHWKEAGEYEKNMGLGLKAIRAYLPDITAEELAAIPNSPTVAKLLAKIGSEVGEDRQVQAQAMSDGDFDAQLAAIQSDPAYMDASHPQHKTLIDKQNALFEKRYPTKKT